MEELGEPGDENIPSHFIFWVNIRENRNTDSSEGNIAKMGLCNLCLSSSM